MSLFQRDSVMEYTIPCFAFDAKDVKAFYERWSGEQKLDADIEIRKVQERGLLLRLLARDIVISVDVRGKSGAEIIKVYNKMVALSYIEPLRQSMMEKKMRL